LVEVYLGDYVDRGPCSPEVIELLIERQRQQPSMICLKGNHEQMLLEALDDATAFHRWLVSGGETTLASFRGRSITSPINLETLRQEFKQILPEAHLAFLSSLPAIHARAGFLFVHAGIRPGVPIDDQPEADLLWIREPFLSSHADFGAIVVHGHTRAPEPVFRANRIGLDTGAYFSNVLTCLLISATGAEIIQTAKP
jgi:serine/threonine protein phosphatase 1